jgi:hypothetical protein
MVHIRFALPLRHQKIELTLKRLVGARGFELCPFTQNCPIFNELQKQMSIVHTLFTDSSEKPLKVIRIAEEEK